MRPSFEYIRCHNSKPSLPSAHCLLVNQKLNVMAIPYGINIVIWRMFHYLSLIQPTDIDSQLCISTVLGTLMTLTFKSNLEKSISIIFSPLNIHRNFFLCYKIHLLLVAKILFILQSGAMRIFSAAVV